MAVPSNCDVNMSPMKAIGAWAAYQSARRHVGPAIEMTCDQSIHCHLTIIVAVSQAMEELISYHVFNQHESRRYRGSEPASEQRNPPTWRLHTLATC